MEFDQDLDILQVLEHEKDLDILQVLEHENTFLWTIFYTYMDMKYWILPILTSGTKVMIGNFWKIIMPCLFFRIATQSSNKYIFIFTTCTKLLHRFFSIRYPLLALPFIVSFDWIDCLLDFLWCQHNIPSGFNHFGLDDTFHFTKKWT